MIWILLVSGLLVGTALSILDIRRLEVPLLLILVFLALCGCLFLVAIFSDRAIPLLPNLPMIERLISLIVVGLVLGGIFFVYRAGFGEGDVLFALALAPFIPPLSLSLVYLASSLGGLATWSLLWLRRRKLIGKIRIPFIPFLWGAHLLVLALSETGILEKMGLN